MHAACVSLLAIVLASAACGARAAPTALLHATPHRPSGADSAEIRFWTIPVDTTRVTARRPDRREQLAFRSVFATLIAVAADRGAELGVADILTRAGGVTLQRYGGPGTLATVSIRGADPGEVEVFLDRTPLRSAAQGFVDLNAIDLAPVEWAEVYRSAPPADLGGEAAGAAVRLVTARGGARRTGLRLTAGSHGTTQIEALASGALSAQRYLLAASRFRTDGDFRYFSDNATEHEDSDDSWQRWSNGDVLRNTLFGKLNSVLPGSLELECSSQFTQRDQGIPGLDHRPTRAVRLDSRGRLHRAEIGSGSRFGGALNASLYGFDERVRREYRDPLRELAVTGTPMEVEQRLARNGLGVVLRGLWDRAPLGLGRHALEFLGELRREELRSLPPPGRPEEERRRRRSQLLSLGDTWSAGGDRLRMSACYRWERNRDNYTGANPYRPFVAQPEHRSAAEGPRLGAHAALGRGHALKANLARQSRFPTFTELFGYSGTLQGNARLAPETGWRWDAGWTWGSAPRGGLTVRTEHVYYESHLREMIVFVTVSDRETKPLNLDRARIRGYEAALILEHLPGLRDLRLLPAAGPGRRDAALSVHLTWQDARDKGASPIYHGKQLTYHPPLQARTHLDLTQGRWSVAYTGAYRAGAFWGRSNLPQFKTAARWHHDLQVSLRMARERVWAALRVENLADTPLEDVRGYPLPGRSWFGTLELRL